MFNSWILLECIPLVCNNETAVALYTVAVNMVAQTFRVSLTYLSNSYVPVQMNLYMPVWFVPTNSDVVITEICGCKVKGSCQKSGPTINLILYVSLQFQASVSHDFVIFSMFSHFIHRFSIPATLTQLKYIGFLMSL